MTKVDVLQTKCLRRIMKIFWLNTIGNKELMKNIYNANINNNQEKALKLDWTHTSNQNGGNRDSNKLQ